MQTRRQIWTLYALKMYLYLFSYISNIMELKTRESRFVNLFPKYVYMLRVEAQA